MPFSRKAERALASFRHAAEAGRFPHAILIAGAPRGEGGAFADALLQLLFHTTPEHLHAHADIRYIEPESKSRQILIDDHIRPLIEFTELTSYEGGWKAGVILFAERMNPNAQNALLKTLEEPPPKTVLMLVSELPAALLATIRSRVQYVNLMQEAAPDAPWLEEVLDLLRNPPARHPIDIQAWADALAAPLRRVEETAKAAEEALAEQREAENPNAPEPNKDMLAARIASRISEAREEIFRTIQLWQRDIMAFQQGGAPLLGDEAAISAQAEKLTPAAVRARIAAVETARKRLSRNISPASIFFLLARALSI